MSNRNGMRVVINRQTEMEEALSLVGYGIERDRRDGFVYDATQQILYDLFCYFLITRGTGIELVIDKQPTLIRFVFQESKSVCVEPEAFINQICSDRWALIVQRYKYFQKYLNTDKCNVFGLTIQYSEREKKWVVSRANLLKITKNGWL